MKILLLFCAFSAAFAVVPPECSDPTFACQDLQSARLCKVVHDCIEDVWSKMTVPESKDNDQVCDICKEMVKEARDQLLSNMTQEEIKEVFEGSCKLIPVKLVADACIKVVDEIIPQLIEMLASRMDPTMVCTVSGMCFPTGRNPFVKVNDELTCEFCEHVLEHVKDLITTNSTMEEFRGALLNFCNHTGSFHERCTDLVNEYYDMIFNFIKNLDSKGMCTLMGLCDKTTQPLVKLIPAMPALRRVPLIKLIPAMPIETNEISPMQPLVELIPADLVPKKAFHKTPYYGLESQSDNIVCDLCKEAMNELQKQLSDPSTKQQLKQLAEQGCSILPQSLKSDCINFVDQNIDALIDIMQQELKPDNVCPALGLCPSGVWITSPRVKDLECDVCKDVVADFREKLKNPESKTVLLTMLEEGCMALPSGLATECKSFVDDNIDFILNMLINDTDPQMVCSVLSICPAPEPKKEISVKVKDVECDLCKEVVGKVEDMVKDKKTEDEIKKALDSVCSYLPKSMAAKCQNFVDTYTDLVVQLLMQELDPETVCEELKLCTGSIKSKPQKSIINDMQCDLCKDVIGQIEGLVKDKKTEDEIRKALDTVCSILPSKISAKCEKFIDEYTETIITLLMMELDPSTICGALKVCPMKNDFAVKRAKAKDIECQSCQYALHFLQEKLMSNDTQARLKDLLKRVCDFLPNEELKDNCNAFVDEYGDSLLVLVAQQIDPNSMCSRLGMCPTSKIHLPVHKKPVKLSANVCTICESVVASVDKLLEEDSIDQDLTKFVEKVCTVLPTGAQSQCKTILEAYGPYILQMIGQLADPTQLCQEIDLCARPPTHAHLIGGSKCTFGPAYWCTTPVHAAACKAEKFCKERVW